MRSYKAARGFFSYIEFFANAALFLGAILALFGGVAGGQTSLLTGAISAGPGLLMMGVGAFILVNIQTARAAVDSAEYAQQSLQVSRDQLEVSRQILRLSSADAKPDGYETKAAELTNVSFDTDEQAAKALAETKAVREPSNANALPHHQHQYDGTAIEERDGKFMIEDRSFDTLVDAKLAVDGDQLRSKLARNDG